METNASKDHKKKREAVEYKVDEWATEDGCTLEPIVKRSEMLRERASEYG